MPNSELYDAIIVGGGPAGLSIGAELSKKNHKVLVLEKGEIGQTARSWIVPGYILAKLDPDIQQYAYSGVKRFLEYTPDFQVEWNTVGPWDVDEKWKVYSYINQKGILTHWADITNSRYAKPNSINNH